jgi:hypothetical protein
MNEKTAIWPQWLLIYHLGIILNQCDGGNNHYSKIKDFIWFAYKKYTIVVKIPSKIWINALWNMDTKYRANLGHEYRKGLLAMIDYSQFIEIHHLSINRQKFKYKTFLEKHLQCNFMRHYARWWIFQLFIFLINFW